mgnify:CR=1 FL=1
MRDLSTPYYYSTVDEVITTFSSIYCENLQDYMKVHFEKDSVTEKDFELPENIEEFEKVIK